MTQMYTVFGRQIGSHYLAMITLGTLFGTGYAFAGGNKKAPAATPPINAASSDEADFIKKFLESADEGSKKEAAAKH